MIEEFHIIVMVPRRMTKSTCATIRRTLNSKRFHTQLQRAIQEIFTRHASLRQARIVLGR